MIRRCDGTDNNLTRWVPDDDYNPATMTPSVIWDRPGQSPGRVIRCACGRAFDDMDRLTIWPHQPV